MDYLSSSAAGYRIYFLAQDAGIEDVSGFVSECMDVYHQRENPDESVYQFIIGCIKRYKERNTTHPE